MGRRVMLQLEAGPRSLYSILVATGAIGRFRAGGWCHLIYAITLVSVWIRDRQWTRHRVETQVSNQGGLHSSFSHGDDEGWIQDTFWKQPQ